MQNITEFIKKIMEERGMTYELLASLSGMSKQNVWDKLNKRACPNFENVKKMLTGMGFEIAVKQKEKLTPFPEMTVNFFCAVEDEQISYEIVEKILDALGYELTIREDTHKNVNKGIDNY